MEVAWGELAGGLARELEAAVAAVRQAALLARAVQGGIAPETLLKRDRSPVTVADLGSQALVCRALEEAFPNDPVVGEEDAEELRLAANAALAERVVTEVTRVRPGAAANEVFDWIDRGGADADARRFWTLDPIDGTKGFLRGKQYAISLALVLDGQVTIAALGCPNLAGLGGGAGVVLAAARGNGAYELPIDGPGAPRPVRVSRESDPRRIRFCESVEADHSSHQDAARVASWLGIQAAPVRLDSQAKYAVVARGEAEAYLRLPMSAEYREKIWDHAGGALVVTEAGGRVTDVAGEPLDFSRGSTLAANRGVIASNGTVHQPILAAVRKLGIG